MDNENIYETVYDEVNTNEKNQSTVNEENVIKTKKRKKSNGLGKTIAIALTCSLLGGAIGSAITYSLHEDKEITNTIIQNPPEFTSAQGALSTTEAFNKVAPAVVVVSAKGITVSNGFFPQQTDGIGTGFIINEEGDILTNYHVIEGAKEVSVTLSDNREVKATVVNYDQEQDVAMLRIVDDIQVPAVVELGDSDALQPGEAVLAIGTPLSTDLSQTVTAGIISAKNRNITTETGVRLNLIQTDTSINPGNSGGPLINTKGQVIGINTLKMSGEAEGLGFAIPINDVKGKIEALSKPILTLGISIRAVNADLAKQLNLEEGLYVVEVSEFSPAEKAGIKPGDVITEVDGNRIKTFDELQKIKGSKNEGDILKIKLVRDGNVKNVELKLTSN